MLAALWPHLFPPFDAWWPNIVAAVVWGTPAFVGQHFALRLHHRRVLAEHVEAMRRAEAATADRQADKISELIDAAHDRLITAVTDTAAKRRRARIWE